MISILKIIINYCNHKKNIVKIQTKENIDFDQIDKNYFKDLNFNNPTK